MEEDMLKNVQDKIAIEKFKKVEIQNLQKKMYKLNIYYTNV